MLLRLNICLENKIMGYIKMRLRAPPANLVTKWGAKLGLSKSIILEINQSVPLRAELGTNNFCFKLL